MNKIVYDHGRPVGIEQKKKGKKSCANCGHRTGGCDAGCKYQPRNTRDSWVPLRRSNTDLRGGKAVPSK
jgi:hypothetical protein